MDKIAVLDFGGQYAHLIANRVRRLGVYSEIFDGDIAAEKLKNFKALILSGGPSSVHAEHGIKCDPAIFDLGVPVLGICYGHQCIAHVLGGHVKKGEVREYGSAWINLRELPVEWADKQENIFKNLDKTGDDWKRVWMSHFDQVVDVPKGFQVVAFTEDCPIAGMADFERKIFSVQFHPEVTHTPCGMIILENFVNLSGASKQWDMEKYIEQEMDEIKRKVGDKKVFLLISGGVDSTVAFLLLAKALGEDRIYALFVDTGFMRLMEREEVQAGLKKAGVNNLHVYDASKEYFEALKGIYEPEEKRKIIGNLFLDIQSKVSEDLKLNPDEWILGQGTIYPDTIETGGTKHADTIKTHHNRVQRVQKLVEEGKVVEPLVQLYKDEVRKVGEKLGLAVEMVWRHPFPGPGLAVRVLCARGEDYPDSYQDLEYQIKELIADSGLEAKILPVKSVGVQGDERTYAHPVVVYGKPTSWENLTILSTQLTNQFPQVNRVLYGLWPGDFRSFEVKDSCLTKERISTSQMADKIVMDYLKEAKLYSNIWQFPTVLIPLSVNSQNGESIVLRPVQSEDVMSANFYMMEWEKLDELVSRLKDLEGITGIFYDITNKPPGTVEWE